MTDWIVVGVASIVLWVYDVYKARINPRIEALHPAAKAAIFCVLALIVLVFGRYGLGFDPAGSVYGGY
jgi:NADH:ubiquinone oxidoreductase subunit 2 (subunit N)